MGWTYGRGPGCTETKVGQLVSKQVAGNNQWQCTQGCGGTVDVADVSYYSKGANPGEKWEQGEKSFSHTFIGQGPYTVAYSGGNWMDLDGGKGGGTWNLETVTDLRQRSDTGLSNSSPVTLSKPIYYTQYDCDHKIRIPVLDPDGDRVRCRMANGSACQSVCDALPGVTLDEDTCTLTFRPDAPTSYSPGGWYAVAITVEDSPTSPITVGGQTYNPGDVLTSVPVQFLIQTPTSLQPCDWRPVFVNDTPAEGAQIVVRAGDTLNLNLYATNLKNPAATISSIQVLGPRGMTQGAVTPDDKGRNNVFTKQLTWTPTPADAGEHILCAIAEDSTKHSSEARCFSVKAWDIDPCDSTPCQHGATCTRVGDTAFTCTCTPGYTDHLCATDIDECVSAPCQNGATCVDQVNGYLCQCAPGYTDLQCQTDVNECVSAPCQNGATCVDQVNGYLCQCAPGYTDLQCQTDIDECVSAPCQNGATCVDQVNGYLCQCAPGYTDLQCQTDIDECSSAPCQNGGTCVDEVNGYLCQCAPGYTDLQCQTDIDECVSAPCQNSGTCIDQVNGYLCQCAPGYTDLQCQTDIDECVSVPCQNGGTCVDQVNGYLCQCAPGYTDLQYQTGIDECVSAPCQNGGTCVDQVNGYLCQCAPGYTDLQCQTGVDHCASSPCLNGGVCTNGFHGFTCSCQGNWKGKNCGVLLQTGTFNPAVNHVQTWPGLSQSLSQQHACPRAANSDCHCVIARNIHAPSSDSDDASRSARDALDTLIGLPIGLVLGVATYLLAERCFCAGGRSSLYTSCVPRVGPLRARLSWGPFSRRRPSHLSTPGGPSRARWGMPPVESGGGTGGGRRKGPSMPTNIYRATFNDSDVHATATKTRPNTYTSGDTDWTA